MPSRVIALLAGSLMMGCVTQSPAVQDRLKLISAGHTGCLPDANEITNVQLNTGGSTLWNATCRGKVYLCSAVLTVGNSESVSCAPAVP